ncbi:MAG: hypothetical protein QMC89_01245 [Candidatus Hodarchaeaceae archaeon]|nr:hypothetical protein [Candidatus Hodarchaeaceae archaeon]
MALDPERMTISSMYREIPSFDVFSMRAEEMLAEKARAIFTRNKPRIFTICGSCSRRESGWT